MHGGMTSERLRYVFIVRHGERRDRQGVGTAKVWQEECEAKHAHDPPLSDGGVQQATLTGQCIARICADVSCRGASPTVPLHVAVLSSPLRRCAQTAQCIAAVLNATCASPPPHSSNSSDADVEEPRCNLSSSLELTTGLYELMTQELFPVGPSFAVSPHWDLTDVCAVDDSVRIVERYPESKPQSTARTIAALQQRWPLLSASVDAVVVVAHQFNCRVLASHFVSLMVASAALRGSTDGQQHHTIFDETNASGWASKKHIDWKQAARLLLSTGQRDAHSSNIPHQTELRTLEFDVCSITLFEFGGCKEDPDQGHEGVAARAGTAGTPTRLHLASYAGHLAPPMV